MAVRRSVSRLSGTRWRDVGPAARGPTMKLASLLGVTLVALLLLLPTAAATAPRKPPAFRAPYSGSYSASHVNYGSCVNSSASLVTPVFKLSTGGGRMGSHVTSSCTTGGSSKNGLEREILVLFLSTWTAVVSNAHVAKVTLRANWSVAVASTASAAGSGLAYATLGVNALIDDITTGASYCPGSCSGYTNTTRVTGNNTTTATLLAKISFAIPWTTTAGDSYLFAITIVETAYAQSGYSGASGSALMDIGTGNHRIVVLSLVA